MLRPLTLPVFPSCRDAISWSADGELAIAAGEYFQIMTPTNSKGHNASNSDPDWTVTRVRANLFTNAEWPAFLPGDRDQFSVAGEQSTAHIIGLAWSPAGLAKYRRSVLLVLTSNMVLSLWEPLGLQQQWTRVGIVNHVFWSQSEHSQDPSDHGYQKTNIRSFTWCDSVKASTPKDSLALSTHENRWGTSLLIVVNDLNQISLIQLRRSTSTDEVPKYYGLQILATYPLKDQDPRNNLLCSGSLLENVLQKRQRTISLCCGPWLSSRWDTPGDSESMIAVVAAVCGTQLRLIKVEAMIKHMAQDNAQECTLSAKMEEHSLELLNKKWANNHVIGPIGWLHTGSSTTMVLAVGIMGGLITIAIPTATYNTMNGSKPSDIQVREWPIHEPKNEDFPNRKDRHFEPISAMVPATNIQGNACKLHLGTLGGAGLTTELNHVHTGDGLQQPQWKRMIEDFQEQFDLEHDLGGMLVSRIWGLAAYRDITATIFTHHPTDMIEYRVSSDDSSTIVFSEEFGRIADTRNLFTPQVPSGQATGHDRIVEMLHHVLPNDDDDDDVVVGPDEESQQLIYIIACRVIVGESDKSLRARAQRCLERLAIVTGADLTEEISTCGSPPSLIAARSVNHITGPGGHIYEKCDVCGAGMGWSSTQQAQCANGHVWARCGLSFLSIQEPGISKYCSFCRTEALDEEYVAIARGRKLCELARGLFETFDTCLYCAGKFQPNY